MALGAGAVGQDLGDTVDYVSGFIMHESAEASLLEKVLMWETISTDLCRGPFQGHGRFTPRLSWPLAFPFVLGLREDRL